MKNKEPAVMTFFLPGAGQTVIPAKVGVTPGKLDAYVDLSQIASVMNRRFYRQGLNWAVAGIKIQTGLANGTIEVGKLPNTWITANSYTKSFKAWQRANREAMDETESVRPRFLDFKIYADAEHHTLGFPANLRPASLEPTALSFYDMGEWTPSKVHIPVADPAFPTATNDFEILATGQSFVGVGASGHGAVSMIEGYANSRSLPNRVDPNAPADADDTSGLTPENWIQAMFNEGTDMTDEIIEDMLEDNNQAPYPFEGAENVQAGSLFPSPYTDTMYPGGANQAAGLAFHDAVYYSNTAETIVQTSYLKGGNFPCGLIKFQMTNNGDSDATVNIIIDLIPGDHRGYMAETMLEM
jgi:hypothetical protein